MLTNPFSRQNTMVEPIIELTGSKCAEMFTESIPGIIIQLFAIFKLIQSGGQVTSMAYTSLLVSILTTAFTSAQISYGEAPQNTYLYYENINTAVFLTPTDFDTDPLKRASNPDFYGVSPDSNSLPQASFSPSHVHLPSTLQYVPDGSSKRTILFVSMIMISSLMIFLKCLFIVFLGSFDSLYPIFYLVGDMLLYLGIKVAREDFIYWLPLEGLISVAVSVLIRFVSKTNTTCVFCVVSTNLTQLNH